jgi:electron transport complex protein RnfB
MPEEPYRRLAQHLDRLPEGFPPSESGADLRLLQMLFTPEEADLATYLTLDREQASTIATRARRPTAEVEGRLQEMARKGLIFSVQPEEGPPRYHAVPFVIGIYEFQVNNLSEELLEAIAEHERTAKPRPPVQTLPQMRTIPIGQSIEPHLEALPYEQVDALIAGRSRYSVGPCICRRKAKMTGGGCDAPDESCLMFDDWADYYVGGGRARYIDRDEVAEILAQADAANLVLQPSNSQDPKWICCCCGCCCGVLHGLQRQPKPAEAVVSAFIATLDAGSCAGCWTCLDRCQMGALAEDGDRVALNADRCIGCGLCVSTCPSGALTLARKPEGEHSQPPPDLETTWRTIVVARAAARGWG